MKQLFLKSNLLHIRTNEGEFEVSNPEIIGDPETIKIIFNDGKPFGCVPIEPVWPGGVEFETIAPHPECYKARECLQLTNGLNCSQAYDARTRSTSLCAKAYKLARLLPKEEKKEFKTVLGDSIKAHGINNDLPGHLIEPDFLFPKHTTLGQGYHIKKDYNKLTESAYKEPQDKEQLIGLIIDDFENRKEIFVPAVESSEPQEKEHLLKDWKWPAIEIERELHKYLGKVTSMDGKSEFHLGFRLCRDWIQKHYFLIYKANKLPIDSDESEVFKSVSAPSESHEELSYDKIRSEYLNHRGRIWTKEEVMLKWIIENYKFDHP